MWLSELFPQYVISVFLFINYKQNKQSYLQTEGNVLSKLHHKCVIQIRYGLVTRNL
jgi:hypothetical protein